MKALCIAAGVVAGMAISMGAVCAAYPDMSRRMMRDGRRMVRCSRRAVERMFQ